MKNSNIFLCCGIFFLLSVPACSSESGLPISERLHLREIDPNPIAFPNPGWKESVPDGENDPCLKGWRITDGRWRYDDEEQVGIVETTNRGVCISDPFPAAPGCYYFQMDQKTFKEGTNGHRSLVTAGNADAGLLHDALYCDRNTRWMTFSHYFRLPEDEKTEDEREMRLAIRTKEYLSSLQEMAVETKNIRLLPAQALVNLARKNEPLKDIYWGVNAVSRNDPAGDFLPLGRKESIEQDYQTKKSHYRFSLESSLDKWGLYPSTKNVTVFPPASTELRPIVKMSGLPCQSHASEYFEEIVLKFELQPIRITSDGGLRMLKKIRFLSARMEGDYGSGYGQEKDGVFWSTDGKKWKELALLKEKPEYGSATIFPNDIFPCETLCLKFKKTDENYRLGRLRFRAELDTDEYSDIGQTNYFRVEPGSGTKSGITAWPLYTARNQVYFLLRNNSDKEILPPFSAKLGYEYSVQEDPKEVFFRAKDTKKESFDDIACHWEILGGENGTIPPGEERIGVFTLETSKLAASSHRQPGPSVSDVFQVEFEVGGCRLINEQMKFFPPRLAIE